MRQDTSFAIALYAQSLRRFLLERQPIYGNLLSFLNCLE